MGSEPCAASSASRCSKAWPPPLIAQELHQADHERIAQPVEAGSGNRLDSLAAGLRQPRLMVVGGARCPSLGAAAFLPAPDHPLGQPPEVLEQDQAEHRRQGPELADRQRVGLLERPDKPGDPRLVELAVGVGDQRQGQRVDAGIAGERRYRQLGQQLIVARRQVVADLAERVGDDVEVVDQPFGVDARQAAAVAQGDELPVDLVEHSLFSHEPAEQGAAARRGGARTQAAASARAGLQPLQAQPLRADRAIAPGIDQQDRHGLDIASRDRRRFDGGRIHAVDILELKVDKKFQYAWSSWTTNKRNRKGTDLILICLSCSGRSPARQLAIDERLWPASTGPVGELGGLSLVPPLLIESPNVLRPDHRLPRDLCRMPDSRLDSVDLRLQFRVRIAVRKARGVESGGWGVKRAIIDTGDRLLALTGAVRSGEWRVERLGFGRRVFRAVTPTSPYHTRPTGRCQLGRSLAVPSSLGRRNSQPATDH